MSNIDWSQLITKAMKDAAQLSWLQQKPSCQPGAQGPWHKSSASRVASTPLASASISARRPLKMKKKGSPDCPAESLEGLQVRPGQGGHAAWMVRVFSMVGRTANP